MNLTTQISVALLLSACVGCSQTEEQKSPQLTRENRSSDSIPNGKPFPDATVFLALSKRPPLVKELDKVELHERKTVAGIPSFIMSFLDSVTGESMMAGPGDDWQAGCTSIRKVIGNKKVYDPSTGDTLITIEFDDEPIPRRSLTYFGIGPGIAMLAYKTGGIGIFHSVIILSFQGDKITDSWSGPIAYDLNSRDEIINYLNENSTKNEQEYSIHGMY